MIDNWTPRPPSHEDHSRKLGGGDEREGEREEEEAVEEEEEEAGEEEEEDEGKIEGDVKRSRNK